MKVFLFVLTFIFSRQALALYEGELRFGSFYETNTYYSGGSKKSDVGFLIEPHLIYTSVKNSKYTLHSNSTASFTKFLSNTNQDHFDYDLNLKNNFKLNDSFQLYITPKAKLVSEPALDSTQERLGRQTVGANLGINLSNDPRRQYILDISYEQEALSQSEYDHLNNQSINAHLYYKKYFLPETFVYFGLSGGTRTYPDGVSASVTRDKYDSQRIEPGLGLEGRLTRYFKIRSYLAYSLISYENESNYSDPVYHVELEEEMSPRDFLIMGLENKAEDSYFTNFQINQKIYLGYGKFLGDQILWISKVEYLYRTYSRPNRRDDQRYVMDSRVEYSFSQKLKLEASVTFDQLSSDAVDPDGPPDPIDPLSSYQNIRLGFFGKYLF